MGSTCGAGFERGMDWHHTLDSTHSFALTSESGLGGHIATFFDKDDIGGQPLMMVLPAVFSRRDKLQRASLSRHKLSAGKKMTTSVVSVFQDQNAPRQLRRIGAEFVICDNRAQRFVPLGAMAKPDQSAIHAGVTVATAPGGKNKTHWRNNSDASGQENHHLVLLSCLS